MFGDDIVVRTRLIPPRPPRRWLRRSRLDSLLAGAAEYPLTIVSASAGYGKSSVLASFAARGGWPTIWLSLAEGVDDPLVFLLHLIYACRTAAPQAGARALALLEQGSGAQIWSQALDALLNDLVATLDDETILILDDYHVADELPDVRALVERLIVQHPPLLHIVLATRRWPQLACIATLQARGELFELGEADLAFTDEEIAELFDSAYDQTLTARESHALIEQTKGWPIALQLVAQGSQPNDDRTGTIYRAQTTTDAEDEHWSHPSFVLGPSSLPQEVLFDYLAQDVFDRQPPEIQTFLLRSSALAELEPAISNRVLGGATSAVDLRALYRRGLFLTRIGADLYRYHPLFHAFLQQRARATLGDWAELHRRAAALYRELGDSEKVLYHLTAIGDDVAVAEELERVAPHWLASGRAVTLLAWLAQLSEAALAQRPELLIARGDAARLLARFDESEAAYAAAERRFAELGDARGQSRALEGQGRVYLDTVRPLRAEELLRRAFKLLPRELRAERAELLRLIAENRLNSGRADQAARLYRVVDRLTSEAANDQRRKGAIYRARTNDERPVARPSSAMGEPRVLLRLGRLSEARALLEDELPHVHEGVARGRAPEAHREVSLLLSLVCALQGDAAAALAHAQQGLEDVRRLGSALSEAVAHIRLGHALQLVAPPDPLAAHTHYLQAMALADTFGVQRTKVEAYMGLALLHGFAGDLAAAQAAGGEGLAIVERSGDAWSAALLWAALGAVGAAAGADDAGTWLSEALRRYQAGKDTYGQALVQLSTAIWHQRAGRPEQAAQSAEVALALAERHGYDGLMTRPTLFGPRDRMMLVPPLLATRDHPQLGAAARAWLAQGFPAIAADEATQSYHPGVTLRLQALGHLRAWRGSAEIEPRAWQRKKAQQLLALLLTNRRRWLLRDQICEMLWPGDTQADAESQFKVTLNALNAALEPARPPRTPPFYIRRQGSAYRFVPPDGAWLDVEAFEERLDTALALLPDSADGDAQPAQDALGAAVSLYQDDYLSDYLYEDWALEERERLRARYLESATTLAELLEQRAQLPDAIRLCELILARDACWEPAYVILMRAYAAQGNRRQVLATYERCVRNLRDQLGLEPMPETTRLYEQVKT
jgi:DNA-binding SARP family transcriptional activator